MKQYVIILLLILGLSIPTVTVRALDCAEPGATGNITISSSCTFAPDVEGAESGNITISLGTLTIRNGQTIVWNTASSIQLSGGDIAFVGTGTMKQGDICFIDADSDGYPANSSHTAQSVGPCSGSYKTRRSLTYVTLSDCNDANGTVTTNQTCYPDADGDGSYAASGQVSVCAASCSAPSYSATPGGDCNDGSALVHTTSTCYADYDIDTYTNGLESGITCYNNADCTLSTKGSASTNGAAVTSYSAGQLRNAANGSDCCDTDANAKPGQTSYFSSPRTTCGGYDYNCDSTETKQTNNLVSYSTCVDVGGSCGYGTVGNGGWQSSIPACGVSGTFQDAGCCPYSAGDCPSAGQYPNCSIGGQFTSAQTQACR